VEETRELTSVDEGVVANATSAERFLGNQGQKALASRGLQDSGGGKKGGWSYELPTGWVEAETKIFREVNLTFGKGGEVYLSQVGGGLKPNIDRWFRQFGGEPKALKDLERISFLGQQAYLVDAEGRFEPGMGKEGKDNQSLVGVVVETPQGVVTVKMTGAADEVAAQRGEFLKFLATLKRSE